MQQQELRTPSAPRGHVSGAPSREPDDRRFGEYARTRCVHLRNELVVANERLVYYLVSRFKPVGPIGAEDLVQVGYLGLIAAVERYDPASGTPFVTFAVPTIVGMIKHHLRDQSWSLKVPRRLRELAIRLRRVRDELEQLLGQAPTPAELAVRLGVEEEEVLEAMEADTCYLAASLDTPQRGSDEDYRESYLEQLAAPEQGYAELLDRAALLSLLAGLEPRQRAIIHGRFFCELSQMQMAAELGLSQMHVSRLERKTLLLLRELLRSSEVI